MEEDTHRGTLQLECTVSTRQRLSNLECLETVVGQFPALLLSWNLLLPALLHAIDRTGLPGFTTFRFGLYVTISTFHTRCDVPVSIEEHLQERNQHQWRPSVFGSERASNLSRLLALGVK